MSFSTLLKQTESAKKKKKKIAALISDLDGFFLSTIFYKSVTANISAEAKLHIQSGGTRLS